MIVERIWAANELRNYHYLVGCGESGEALAIDPLDWRACLERARAAQLDHHADRQHSRAPDHTAGNAGLVQATGAKVLAHARAAPGSAGSIAGWPRAM